MPTLDIGQIKEKIVSGEIRAISVDTNVFDRYHCNLRNTLLRSLSQFQNTNVDVLLSEIITGEIRAHIIAEASETQAVLRKALKLHRRRWNIDASEGLDGDLKVAAIAAHHAEAEIKDFVNYVGLKVVEVHNEMELGPELVRRYFAPLPPFETRESKKAEFPDALALLSLEFYVKDEGIVLLCVSNDGGWKLFAEHSDHVVVVDDLAEALSLFNQAGEPVVEDIAQLWRDKKLPDFAQEVETQLAAWCIDLEFDAEGDGPANVYFDSQQAEFESIEQIGEAKVVSFGGKQITFTVNLTVAVQFYADAIFWINDYVDGDEVTVANEAVDRTMDVPMEVTITATYEDGYTDLEVDDVSVATGRVRVDYGYIDPFAGENPNHEKY